MTMVKEFIKNKKTLLIFLIFFILVFIQHQFMYMYFDDYGYASLSYAYNVERVAGTNYNLTDIIEFLLGHYVNWGGRILFFFIEIVIFKFGISAYRLVQSLVITAIFLFIYLICKEHFKFKDWKIILCIVSLYGLISIVTINNGIFWATASVLYMFPLMFFLAYIYIYDKYINNNKKIFFFLSIFLVLISSFSQEQISSAVVFYTFAYAFFDYLKNKKIRKENIIIFMSALIGFVILMFAPGNQIRMNLDGNVDFYNLPLISKITHNIPNILIVNFSNYYNKLFVLLLFLTTLYISFANLKMEKHKFIFKLSVISNLLILVLNFSVLSGYFDYFINEINNEVIRKVFLIFIILQLILIVYNVVLYLFRREANTFLLIFLSSIVSQAIMLYSPTFPNRAVIPFQFLIFPICSFVFCEIYLKYKNKQIINFVMIPLIVVSSFNFYSITKGYYDNSENNLFNDKKLREVSKNIKQGKEIKKVYLKKLPNDLYTSTQPYMEGSGYTVYWIKQYYDIPDSVELIYE